MSRTALTLVLALLLMLASSLCSAKEGNSTYPETRRVDHVDTYHGVEVADPYRWLEDDPRNSEEIASWLEAQNAVTRRYLDAIEVREEFRQRLTELWNYERYSVPFEKAGKYFFSKNDGLQNQSVLYWSDAYDGELRVLINPNLWSEDGTVALGGGQVSEDGRYYAYLKRDSGSDWTTIHVIEVETGKELDDQLDFVRWANIVWNAESTGFFYIRYPEPKQGEKFLSLATDPMLYFHKLGDSQSDDQLVYRNEEHPDWIFYLQRSEDNRFHVLSTRKGTDDQNLVFIRPVDSPLDGKWTALIGDFDNEFSFLGNVGDKLFFFTDFQAPTKRIVAMDVNQPGRDHLEEILPADEATLLGASMLKDSIIAHYMQDVVSVVRVYDYEGNERGQVELPGLGSAGGFGGEQDDTETFFSYQSYTSPPAVYRYDLITGETQEIRKPQIKFDPSQYESRQDFYTSKDGTRVPIIVTHKKGLQLTGDNPTLLYAYGGFNIPVRPRFGVTYSVWMQKGGVLAIPNLRGGGEYGEKWHLAGKKHKKQNVFDDFIAAAEWLIAEKYTSREKLAIMGGSNGGLLVGAVMTQRPELFGACIPAVGVMDMLRYDRFTAGHFWRTEYGSSANRDEFKTLLAYSPYHNLKPGVAYPATMVMTADTDDRVVPLHSFKFTAQLQFAHVGDVPTLLRVESRAGHGAGTPITKQIDIAADRWAFLWESLGEE